MGPGQTAGMTASIAICIFLASACCVAVHVCMWQQAFLHICGAHSLKQGSTPILCIL